MTLFNYVRSNSFLRIATPVLALALAAAMQALPQGKGKADDDPDRQVKNASMPAGWEVRNDAAKGGRGKGPAAPSNVTNNNGVFHFTMGAAGTFYNNTWTKTGDYKYSARMKMTAPPTHNTSYGIMIGGKDMTGANPVYTYFMVRSSGEYFIANQDGARTVITNWTKTPAAKGLEITSPQADVLGVEVKGADVAFSLNGTEVAKLPKTQLHTDGLIGFRIGHNIDVEVDQVTR
jgi:hypothetical protein